MVHSGSHKLLRRDIILVIGIRISFSFSDLVPWALSVWEIACVAVDGRVYSFSCKWSSWIVCVLLDFSPWDVLFQWLISFSCRLSFLLRHELVGFRVISWHFSNSLINSSGNVGAFEPLWVHIVWSDLWHKLISIREVWGHVTYTLVDSRWDKWSCQPFWVHLLFVFDLSHELLSIWEVAWLITINFINALIYSCFGKWAHEWSPVVIWVIIICLISWSFRLNLSH